MTLSELDSRAYALERSLKASDEISPRIQRELMILVCVMLQKLCVFITEKRG